MSTTLCSVCGTIGLGSGGDGFYYCLTCGTQSQDLVEQGMEDDGMVFNGVYNHAYRRRTPHSAPVQSQAEIDMQTQAEVLTQMQKVNMTTDQAFSQRAGGDADLDDEAMLRNYRFQQNDALDAETLASQLKERYLEGMQMMIQMQCEALVKKFGVSPLICGVFAPIWLRFVASTRVLERGWANETLQAADALSENLNRRQDGRDEDFEDINPPISKYKNSAIFKAEPRTSLYGKKARIVWAGSLKDRIPVAISLAISFLACHIAREAVLPTDLIKWALEGKLPYLAAFVDIEKSLSGVSKPWPLSPKYLLRPQHVIGAWQLELMSGCLAKRVGLQLPPVNFHSISCRFLKQLGFPVEELFPAVSRIYEWLLPPGLWISADTGDSPTRVYVMAMLVVVIRILYNIHGQGYWEKSLSDNTLASGSCDKNSNGDPSQDQLDRKSQRSTDSCVNGANVGNNCHDIHLTAKATGEIPVSSSGNITHFQDQELDATTMLHKLESWDRDDSDRFDYGKDLYTYLKYCNEVIFAGSKMSYDEENIIKHFWKLYEKLEKEDLDPINEAEGDAFFEPSINSTRYNSVSQSMSEDNVGLCQPDCKEIPTAGEPECSLRPGVKKENESGFSNIPLRESSGIKKDRNSSLESIISDMEQNGFHYIRPAKCHPPDTYLSYKKKKINRKFETVVHADYYILLRACARVVKVNAYALHSCVLNIERRLSWIEDRVVGVLRGKLLTGSQE